MARLKIVSGPRSGESHRIERDLVLGRGPLADLRFNDRTVSHRHALITVNADRCFLSDLESGNGTYLNDERIFEPAELAENDEIRIGVSRLVFETREGPKRERWATARLTLGSPDPAELSGSKLISLTGLRASSRISAQEELQRVQKRLAFFHTVGRELVRHLDESDLMGILLEKAMDVLPQADRGLVVLYDESTREMTPTAARTRAAGATEVAVSRTLLEEAVKRREPIVSIDASSEAEFLQAGSIHALDLRAVACVPLLVEDRVVGVLQFDNSRQKKGFGPADLELLGGIAGPIALALENARNLRRLVDRELLEHDLMLARRIQRSFLPAQPPKIPGWDLAVEYSPAQAVGGDLYDFVPLEDGRYGIAIGDVSGKGVSGALLMARLTSALRTAAARSPYPSHVLEELNRLIAEDQSEGMFVTLMYGTLDPASGRFEVANAGHPAIVLRQGNGQCGAVEIASGPALGVKNRLAAPTFGWELAPGDLMVWMSDGLLEAARPNGEQFGEQGVVRTLGRAGRAADEIVANLVESVRGHIGKDAALADDLTILCVGRR